MGDEVERALERGGGAGCGAAERFESIMKQRCDVGGRARGMSWAAQLELMGPMQREPGAAHLPRPRPARRRERARGACPGDQCRPDPGGGADRRLGPARPVDRDDREVVDRTSALSAPELTEGLRMIAERMTGSGPPDA